MGVKYNITEDKIIVEFCLNCEKQNCKGNCEDLKRAKERRKREIERMKK